VSWVQKWIEYSVGGSVLALTERGLLFDDPPAPQGTLAVQLGFRVAPKEVDRCAKMLANRGVTIVSGPEDQPWGHRTLFFRDPEATCWRSTRSSDLEG
jgi:lactoylglutathione lyase